MSNPDSFIDEVTEEVRRDRLFAMLRRYGWIAVAVVLILVGGTAYNEWRTARADAAAQALGDAVNAALGQETSQERAAALAAIDTTDMPGSVVVKLLAAAEQLASEDSAAAATALRSIADDANVAQPFRQLAALKLALALEAEASIEERRALLEPLASGSSFRLLAEEQLALIDIEAGETEAAISRLQNLLADAETTSGLRQRATQLIVALGGEL
ncbi:hypothetical protein ACMU_13230 [Actibacterium mucosum KCTC 23349]|uniref:Ancillary SecYEG translocon subunit/Cell division coordinator CpoB TPR domain-containing protein n=1 Tax=Actibacterium mucosum KCTC 23349 TaxID=1454373 RepID=A0A037ZHN1_9RHOB|nr:tetratricopeptide repeat protein [Actibacterium mucosum]KAJ55648.1 hypothetical protein ACMU_13230 [Actibacterium mucosum KCTC 23349]